MKEQYKFGIRLHKFFIERRDMELFFFYNQIDSGIEVVVENEDLEFHCVYHIPYQYFQKFHQQYKGKICEIKDEDLEDFEF